MRRNSIIWIGWVIFAAAFIIGCALTYVTFKRKRFEALIIGLGSGAALAAVL